MASEFLCRLSPVGRLSARARGYWDVLAPTAAAGGVTQDEAPILTALCRTLARADAADEALEVHGVITTTEAGGVKGNAAAIVAARADQQIGDFLERLALTRRGRAALTEAIGKKREAEEQAHAPTLDDWDDLARPPETPLQ